MHADKPPRTCSNPSGVTIPEFRKHEIYAVCRKWDMLIIEDDPCECISGSNVYPIIDCCPVPSEPQLKPTDYFLQTRTEGTPTPRTFLSIDTDGRVVRVDSFSKVVAPGARLGFITAHKTLLEKLMNSRESATVSQGTLLVVITARADSDSNAHPVSLSLPYLRFCALGAGMRGLRRNTSRVCQVSGHVLFVSRLCSL